MTVKDLFKRVGSVNYARNMLGQVALGIECQVAPLEPRFNAHSLYDLASEILFYLTNKGYKPTLQDIITSAENAEIKIEDNVGYAQIKETYITIYRIDL